MTTTDLSATESLFLNSMRFGHCYSPSTTARSNGMGRSPRHGKGYRAAAGACRTGRTRAELRHHVQEGTNHNGFGRHRWYVRRLARHRRHSTARHRPRAAASRVRGFEPMPVMAKRRKGHIADQIVTSRRMDHTNMTREWLNSQPLALRVCRTAAPLPWLLIAALRACWNDFLYGLQGPSASLAS